MAGSHTFLICIWLIVLCFSGHDSRAADSIYFKDGMRTVCHGRAWEEKGYVHCEYDGGVLSYPAADVDRIEKGTAPHREPEEPSPAPPAPPAPLSRPSAPPSSVPSTETVQAEPSGVLFYDPRRTQRYWSRPDRKHDAYPEAIAALAEEFDRPAQWVEENMGNSNDLGIIRETLSGRRQAPQAGASDDPTGLPAGVEFYNPRRAEKYWTGPEARHKSYTEAIEALAREFNQTADWVERFMGDSNDLEQIRASLRGAQAPKAE
jgi:hypothetical protein